MQPSAINGPEAIKEARSRWRRGQIVEAATRLLETQGFHQTSVNALAKEAGISVGTIYQYVKNKEDILLLVISDILEAYREEVPRAMAGIEDPVRRLAAGFQAYCRVVDSRRAGTVLGYRESSTLGKEGLRQMKRLEEETTELLVNCVAECVDAGVLVEHDTDITGWDLTLLAHMWSLKQWHFAERRTVDGYARAQFAIVVGALIRPEFRDQHADLLRLPTRA